MPSGPTLWRTTSQETPFPPSTKDLYGSHKCRKTKFHLEHCSFIISIHRMFSWGLTRFTGMFSIQRLTQPRWARNVRLSITENTTACSKWFPFLDHTASKEAMMTEKEAIARNQWFQSRWSKQEAQHNFCHKKTSAWEDERQMKFYKYKLSAGWQVWNFFTTVKKYRFFHIVSREHRYGRLDISCYSSYKQKEEILDQSQVYIIFLKEWKCFQDLYLTDIMQAQVWALREGKLISGCVGIS